MDHKTELKKDFISLGIQKGDKLLVHSSLNSVGRFENRAEIIVDVLTDILGEKGTLLMPSLSYESVTRENPFFDVSNTPSCVGGLTEYFRSKSFTKRSIHPTHSVCGIGEDIEYLLDEHIKDTTPCGNFSPFRRLKNLNGKVLFLGCGCRPNTSMHGIEELVIPPYLFDNEIEFFLTLEDGNKISQKHIPHDFKGYGQRYERIIDILDKDDFSRGTILSAESYLINCVPMWESAHQALIKNPLFFVDKSLDE